MSHEPALLRPLHLTVTRLPPLPLNRISFCFLVSFFHGRSRSILYWLDRARMMREVQPPFLPPSWALASPQVATAPSLMLRLGSGISRSGSTCMRSPRPLHSTHMPRGELNENDCGDSSGKPMPQVAHALSAEYARAVRSPSTWATSLPLPSRRQVSTESDRRPMSLGLIDRRSMTISMVCFFFFSRPSTSSRRTTMPSTRART